MIRTDLNIEMAAHFVTQRRVVEGVQLVGDVFANEVAEYLIQERIRLQEVCEPLSGPAQEFAVFLCSYGHLSINGHMGGKEKCCH